MTPMPATFLAHGSPMNALERNRYTDAWLAIGAAVPRPRAILMVSAHWYVPATAVTAMARPGGVPRVRALAAKRGDVGKAGCT
jgi:4,5-DOPA dioxygenase extradiol